MNKLSILIPTHQRPLLFERCISSVYNNITQDLLSRFDIEIIVNNDSNDVREIYHKDITTRYLYCNFSNIYKTYEMLYNAASGTHFVYLEDDDYFLPEFFTQVDLSYDINFVEYVKHKAWIEIDIRDYGLNVASKFRNRTFTYNNTFGEFINNNIIGDFQLTQLICSKSVCSFPRQIYERDWKTDPHGDEDFLNNIIPTSTLNYISKRCFVQTIDGGDNLTFHDCKPRNINI